MGKKLSTFWKDDQSEYCEIHVELEEEQFYIKYYKEGEAARFHTEELKGKSLRYVEDAAENWALGIKKIDPQYEGTLL